MADQMQAELLTVHVKGDIVTELTRVARERNVACIVIGHSERSRWQELLRGSVVNDPLRALPDVDINVVASRPEAAYAT
jgi:two-component system, OmpR family, sensor histidine kinase KdpD